MNQVVVCLLALSAAARPMSLQAAVDRALEHSPDLKQSEAEVLAAEATLEGAGRWLRDNPRLSASAGPRTASGGTELNLGVELVQPVEIAGQRGARVEAARAALVAASASLERRRSEIAARTQTAFVSVLALQARVGAEQRAVDFTRTSVQAVRERMAAGASSQIDLYAALVDLGRVQRELLLDRQALVDRRAELRLLLALDPSAELELEGELEAVVERIEPRELSTADAVALAFEHRADLRAARAGLRAAEAEASVARREAVPTPALGVGYENEGDEQVVQGLIAFDLPLFDRNQAERGSSAARVLQEKLAVEALERRVHAEVATARQRHETARAGVALYRDGISDAAEQGVSLVQEGYRAGKLDLLQLLLIQRNALEARGGYIDALLELARASAELNLALGGGS